jgi:hypothetical protein
MPRPRFPPVPRQPPSFHPTLLCLSSRSSAPSAERWPPSTALVRLGAMPSRPRPWAAVLHRELSKHRADRLLLCLPRPPSRRVPPSATDMLLHHRIVLRLSSPLVHLFSGLPSLVSHHRPASPPWARHGEPLCYLCPKSGPSLPGLAPWHLLPRPLTASRPDSIDEPRAGGEWGTPLFRPWAKRPHGLGQEGCGQVGLAHSNSSISCFHSELIQNLFEFSLNLWK